MTRKNIAVVCGGFSGEADVSLKGAVNVLNNIDKEKYNAYKVFINKDSWYVEFNSKKHTVNKNDFSFSLEGEKVIFHCAFIIIHGTPGEDGKLQGYFDMLGIPYTTSGQMVMAMTFNKYFCNNYVRQLGALIPKTLFYLKEDKIDLKNVIHEIGMPLIVKPNNSGSSIGNSLVKKEEDFKQAIDKAFEIDGEILIQKYIKGREITCGIIKKGTGNIIFPLTEIIPERDFFDYEAKYDKEAKTQEISPANVAENIERECKIISAMLFKELQCKGLARFDYILKDNKLYFLEVNTVPGMSEESIVPGQAKAIGMPLKELFDILIEGALRSK